VGGLVDQLVGELVGVLVSEREDETPNAVGSCHRHHPRV
jgi:hypothetical protein